MILKLNLNIMQNVDFYLPSLNIGTVAATKCWHNRHGTIDIESTLEPVS